MMMRYSISKEVGCYVRIISSQRVKRYKAFCRVLRQVRSIRTIRVRRSHEEKEVSGQDCRGEVSPRQGSQVLHDLQDRKEGAPCRQVRGSFSPSPRSCSSSSTTNLSGGANGLGEVSHPWHGCRECGHSTIGHPRASTASAPRAQPGYRMPGSFRQVGHDHPRESGLLP